VSIKLVALLVLCATAPAVELQAIVTGYCGSDFSGITSTDVDTDDHPTGIAAAPTILPYGTLIKVTGYNNGNWAKVDDTGGAMRKDAKRGIVHIDLRFKTHAEAVQWGRRHMTITVKD